MGLLRRPQSLTGLVLLAFAMVTGPVVIALGYGALGVDRLSRSSAELVARGVEATGLGAELEELTVAMERSARQYAVLERADLLEIYDTRHRRMREVIDRLKAGGDARGALAELSAVAEKLRSSLASDMDEGLLRRLGVLTREIRHSLRVGLSARLRANLEQAQRMRVMFLAQCALAVILALTLGGLFARRITRPVRQLEGHIRHLGERGFHEPIRVGGPADLAALGARLEWLRERLRSLEEEREHFVRQISHELKTPLANIREGSDLLIEGRGAPADAETREVASIVRDNSQRLQNMIEELLELSALRDRRTQLRREGIALRPLVEAVLADHRWACERQALTLHTDVEDIVVHADREGLRSALDNLVSNALKHTPRGGPLRITSGSGNTGVWIEVADAGPGIPAEERERVFRPFHRASQSRGVRGTGIGLTLADGMIRAHGGRIEIADAPEGGACLRIELPAEEEMWS